MKVEDVDNNVIISKFLDGKTVATKPALTTSVIDKTGKNVVNALRDTKIIDKKCNK